MLLDKVTKKQRSRLSFSRFALLLLVAFIIACGAGCHSKSTTVVFEDDNIGLKLEYPSDWYLKQGERALGYSLKPKGRFRFSNFSSVAVNVSFSADPSSMTRPISSIQDFEVLLQDQIWRLNTFFKLEELEPAEPIRLLYDTVYDIAVATIVVPTTVIPEDSSMNQMGQVEPDVFQVIDIYVIESGLELLPIAVVYRGSNEELNSQAEEIVRSIRIVESD